MIIFLPLFIVIITALILFLLLVVLVFEFFAVLIFSVVWTYYLALWHLIWLLFL